VSVAPTGPAETRTDGPSAALAPEPPGVLVRTWALAIGGLALARLLSLADPSGILGANLGGVAAVLFVWLPERRLRARGQPWADFGAPFLGPPGRRGWGQVARGAGLGLLCCLVLFPPFVAGFWLFTEVLPHLPRALTSVLVPYLGAPSPAWRLPERLPLLLAVQLLVVALPEELFYRGWMQTSWARSAPGRGVTVLGARLGAGFLATQLLFAAGHLVTLQPWRLATFLPGLLFGWLRERTGGLAAPVVAHALSNLLMSTLERSFYG
jgi:membrane protease YdiL (CAAX protease family)